MQFYCKRVVIDPPGVSLMEGEVRKFLLELGAKQDALVARFRKAA